MAVLDFRVSSPDSSDAYLADGLADDLASRLGQVRRLTVISRASVKRVPDPAVVSTAQLGERLRTSFLVTGSVRRSGQRVRITAELLRCRDGVQLWSKVYDAVGNDMFSIHDQVSGDVANQIVGRLLPADRSGMQVGQTRDPVAMEAFVRARTLRRTTAANRLPDGIRLLERAIRRDSGFAAAHALLAKFHAEMYHFYEDRSPERVTNAGASADRALALAPGLDDAHVAKALYHYRGRHDYRSALNELEIATRLNPGNVEALQTRALVQRRLGLWDAAIASLARQSEYDPISDANQVMGETYLMMHRYDLAERALRLAAENGGQTGYMIATAQYLAGKVAAAQATMRASIDDIGDDQFFLPSGWGYTYRSEFVRIDSAMRSAVLRAARPTSGPGRPAWYVLRANALRIEGRTVESQAAFDSARVLAEGLVSRRPDDNAAHALLGIVLANLGRRDEALAAARRAVELLPMSRDAVVGPARLADLAEVEILVGEHDSAISRLEQLLGKPSVPSRAILRLDPLYAPLRSSPRFNALIGPE